MSNSQCIRNVPCEKGETLPSVSRPLKDIAIRCVYVISLVTGKRLGATKPRAQLFKANDIVS